MKDSSVSPFKPVASGISIVIPVYNEQHGIKDTLNQLLEITDKLDIANEIITVNDGSSDDTTAILGEFKDRVRVINHRRNRGYGASLKTGIAAARYDWTAITDADGTYPNDRLLDMLALRDEAEADMVIGARTGANVTYSKIRRIPKWFMRRYINWIAKTDVPDFNSGLRIFRTSLARKYTAIIPDGFSFTTTITLALICNHYEVRFMDIDYFKRKGKSHLRPIKDTLRFCQLIARTGMYFAPLRILGPVIAVSAFACFVSLLFDVITLGGLADKSVLLLTLTLNLTLFATLADMIRKFKELD